MDQPIYVDKALFLGRVQQQNAFRAAMREVLDPYNDNDNPYVILLYGDGGMGKTTLSKRLRDIVRWEAPFEGEFELLWIDWEEERRLNPHLQGGRENITPETVFDTIHTAAIRQKWGRHFKAYQRIVDQRAEAEHAAAQALAGDWAGETSALRSLSADAVGKLVRNFSQVPIGDTGEKWVAAAADVGLKLTTEQARKLSEVLQTRLKSRLKPEQFNIYLQPQAQLASALADGLGKIAQRRRLLLVLDTYEIVDYADHWLRKVIADAGSRIVWLISGRDNLAKSRSYGTDYFLGYEAQFAPRLLAYDLPELALADLQAYFAAMVPDRPLSDEEAQMVNQATRGIPLALRVAAEMWAKGTDAADIVGDTSRRLPARDIVGEMTGRYLLHVVKEDDRQALYALALAQGNQRILRAMLTPDDAPAFDWLARVEMLQRAYASVHLEEMRLHDEPALYLRALLRRAEQRERPQVRQLYQRAVAALRQQIAELEEEIPLIEERCEDEEWSQVAIDLAGYLFGLDEREGWQWLLPRFVESLAYSRDLRAGLLSKARGWQDTFSRRGQLRLKKLESGRSGSFQLFDSTPNEEMLEELRKQRHWLVGAGEAERNAILAWQRGQWLFKQERYEEALQAYLQCETGLPEDGEALQKKLGESLYTLAGEFLWPAGTSNAAYSSEAMRIMPKVVTWLPEKSSAWYRLGVAMYLGGEHNAAIAANQTAIERDPDDAYPWHGLGNVYRALGRTDDAIAAYQTAIERDPDDAYPWHGLGNVYSDLGRTDDAIAAYQTAIERDPDDAYPWHGLGNVYRDLGRTDDAIAAYQTAIERDPDFAHPWNDLGNVYSNLGRTDDAIAAYQTAIERDPDDAYPWHGLGNVYRDLGRTDDAIAAYQTAIERDPDDAYPWHGLGNVYRELGRTDDAIAAYQTAIERDPDYAYPWHGLGVVYRELGRTDDAIAAYQTAIERDPDFAHPWNDLGIVYRALGRTDDAITSYLKAIELEPDFAYAHNNLAGKYVESGQIGKAIHHFEERIRLESQTALNALVMLGILSRHDGDTIQSRTYCEQALEIWDTVQQKGIQSRSGLFENKALALLLLERKDEAVSALIDALDSRGPFDVFTTIEYELLQSATQPPDGIDDMLAMVRKAIGQ